MTDIGSIRGKVELSTQGFERSIKKIKKDMKAVDNSTRRTTKSFDALEGALAGLGAGAAFYGMTSAINATVKEAEKLNMAMQGLIEVSKSLGKDVDSVTQAAQEMASKGFMTASESAEAYKTSLAMGLELEETTKLINALGDAAAFNRESHLEWGQAVVQAIRGIKTGESTLTDSAGLTRNLSQMYSEYADQVGKSANKLSESEKVQAAYNGMLKDAALFAGNAETALDGYQGSVAKYNAAMREMKAEIGESFMPIIADTLDRLTPVITSIAKWASENEKLIITISGVTLGTTSLIAGVTALAFAFNTLNTAGKTLGITLNGLKLALGPAGWLLLGLTAVTGAITYFRTQTEATDSVLKQNHQTAYGLAQEYDNLRSKVDTLEESSYEATQAKAQMREIMGRIKELAPSVASEFDNMAGSVDNLTGAYIRNTQEALRNLKVKLGEKKAEYDELRSKQPTVRGGLLTESVLATKKSAEVFSLQQEISALESVLNTAYEEIDLKEIKGRNSFIRSKREERRVEKINTNYSGSSGVDTDSPSNSSGSTYSKTPEQIATQRLNTEMRVLNHKRRMNEITDQQALQSLRKKLDAYGRYAKLRMQLEEQILDTEQKIAQESAEAKAQSAEEKYQASSNWIKKETRRMELAGKSEKEITEMRLSAYERMTAKYGDMANHQESIAQNLHAERMKLMQIEERETKEHVEEISRSMEELESNVIDSISRRKKEKLDAIRKEEQAELDSLDRRKREIEDYYDSQIESLNEEERTDERKEILEEIEKYRYSTSKDGQEKLKELRDRLEKMEYEDKRRKLRKEKEQELRQLSDRRNNIRNFYENKESEVERHYDNLTEAVEEYANDTRSIEGLLQDDRIVFFKQGNEVILSDLEKFVQKYNAKIAKMKDKETGRRKSSGGSSSSGSGSVPSGYDSTEDYVNDDNWHKGKTGDDYKDAFKERVKRLKDMGVFHSGGVVGQNNFAMGDRLLPNEVASILQKGEYVFQPNQLNDLLSATKGGGTTNNYYAPLIQSGDTHLEDEADVSTYWRERELAAQRLMSGGERD